MKRNIFYNIILTVSQLLFPLLTFPYITRIIGPEKLGIISFTQSFSQYFIMFAALGISLYGQREIAAFKGDRIMRSKVFANMLSIHILMTLLMSLIYIIIISIFSRFADYSLLFWLSLVHILLNVFSIEWFYQGMENFKFITIRSIVIRTLFVISIFFLVKQESDFILYFNLILLSTVLPCVINIVYSRNFIDFHIKYLSLSSLKNTFMQLRNCSYYVLLTALYASFPLLFLGFVDSDVAVGNYAVSDKIYKLTISFFTAVSTVMLPRMSNLHASGDVTCFKKYIHQSITIFLPISIMIALFVFLASSDIVTIFVGDKFTTSYIPLKIISPLIVILPIAQIFVLQILLPMRKESSVLKFSFISAVVGVLINIFLVPKLSLVGTAISLLCSEITMTILAIWLTRSILGNVSFDVSNWKQTSFFIVLLILSYFVLFYFIDTPIIRTTLFGFVLLLFCANSLYCNYFKLRRDEFS